ncbi:PecA family PE domain-processing aspartic protease [Mycolicibacter longobardus]|uniref:PE-PGRS family protein n=1 Tax=Mycolicibacter longobardus TaxID=1108812 RepID=A0A1X1YII7_9MYCO|nr:PecA family PE domain-processing aspartic protease [Mycolicibacter longobardus]MCV7384811.1 PecA family PE domain-processing aspartic protease [Mycolicibacter longobardus]ORW10833.1 PE-PGRS family protein [Mycolicibacter longobardus]
MSARRHRLVGAISAAGAFLALSTPAPAANADWDDLFQPILDAFSFVDPGIAADTDPGSSLASLDSLFDGWYQNLVYTPLNSIAPWLFATSDVPGSAVAYGPDTPVDQLPTSFTVPMDVNLTTQPVVNVSVGGGAQTEVLVDTGAAGLVIPIWNINPFGITGLPTGFNIGQFGGYLNYFYLELPTTVTFDGFDADGVAGSVTADTSVAAVLFAFPADFNIFGPWSIEDYLAGTSTGILGIGPNALGPTVDHIPTADLPGELGKGVLIDQPGGQLVFGANPLEGGIVVQGAPWSTLHVSLNGANPTPVNSVIDSGGVFGTMPRSVLTAAGVTPTANGSLPVGTTVQVYTPGGQLLYEYTIGETRYPGDQDPQDWPLLRSPVVINSGGMNTGNFLFAQQPVYIDYTAPDGKGLTIIGGTPIEL